ncbi:hypothetical protein [Pseudomonas sp. B329]|uniref:DUF6917 domain-containing protein n=1 Tax=Pseudomonas sp. B329 TaxID=1553459 RepID=UPI002002D931|nr:hypothetical protein [Pseudomonas sp. B329]MCK3860980.1 hypothetical protein [Pseudomonas sp. B329]
MKIESRGIPSKGPISARLIKLLFHKQMTRGMRLMEFQSRCVRRTEVHELVTTDQRDAQPGDRIDRVGFIGFVEVLEAGVVEAGDAFYIDGRCVGHVLGFDECHFPNHYNILISTQTLLSGDDIEGCVLGNDVEFKELI